MGDKKKICIVAAGDIWAGAEVVLHTLLGGLHKTGKYRLSVILFSDGRLTAELRDQGIPVHVVGEDRSFYEIVKIFCSLIIRIKPDIIHSHGTREGFFALLGLMARGGRCRLVSTQHSLPNILPGRKNFRSTIKIKFLMFLQARFFTEVIAVSDDIKNKLQEYYGFPEKKLTVIHNGIIDSSDVAGNQSASPRTYFAIGAAARFYPVKDHLFLIEIARICRNKQADIKFHLAGDGPERDSVKKLVAKYQLENVCIFLGHVDNMGDFYRDIDAFINTSIHEGIPMSILEAMTYGKPVIAPSVGGIVEIFADGDIGFLVEKREPEVFAELCIKLATDNALYNEMSQGAISKVVNSFSAGKMIESYVGLYDALGDK